ncbi:MAG: hypothetical protein GY757_41805, partial [bacterium]|nr:hypothetical protein [bacterium]
QVVIAKPAEGYATFELLDLKPTEMQLDMLQANLQSAAPDVGYRLELRPTRHLETNKTERLYEEKARIEYQLAYLESISHPRPVLFRFTQKQLPALADVIRSFPLKVIRDSGLKYGFQATRNEPAGLHFVLVEPGETIMNGLDPLPLHGDLDTSPMRYRLDPFWARHYHEPGGNSLVFVPEGSALFPSMHDWDRGSMDSYLRETMQHWFTGQAGAGELPGQPIYIFDGESRPDSEIRISVLDGEALKPLHTRLGWINDNLTVLHAVGIETLITSLAKDVSWQELYKELMDDANTLREDFETTAVSAGKQVADMMQGMTETLTGEVNRVVDRTFQMVEEVTDLDRELKKWDNVCTNMRALLTQVGKMKESTLRQTVQVNSEFYTMVRQVDFDLAEAQKSRDEVETKVARELEKLKETYSKLKNKLANFKVK